MDALALVAPAARKLASVYGRSGADLPFGDPLPTHGTEMEGWFWRLSDPASGRVVVALCSANRHPDGGWSTAAIAVHPGMIVRSTAIDGVVANRERFLVQAESGGHSLHAERDRLRLVVDDCAIDATFRETADWPMAFGGGGVFSSVPFLNQYWHPYRLGGRAKGTLTCGDDRWSFADATVYCERNWGAGFPRKWWWGQAHDFDGADVCVAFSGGLLEFGPLHRDVTGVVVRLGDRVIRLTPPALVTGTGDGTYWHVDARSPPLSRRAGRSRRRRRAARAAGAAARAATQHRLRLRVPGRAPAVHGPRAGQNDLRRDLEPGRPRNRKPPRVIHATSRSVHRQETTEAVRQRLPTPRSPAGPGRCRGAPGVRRGETGTSRSRGSGPCAE